MCVLLVASRTCAPATPVVAAAAPSATAAFGDAVVDDDDDGTDEMTPLGFAAPHTMHVLWPTSHSVKHSPQCHRLFVFPPQMVDPFFAAAPHAAPDASSAASAALSTTTFGGEPSAMACLLEVHWSRLFRDRSTCANTIDSQVASQVITMWPWHVGLGRMVMVMRSGLAI
jgi:hypothetical protein